MTVIFKNQTSSRRGTGDNTLRMNRQMKSDFHVEPGCLEILYRKNREDLELAFDQKHRTNLDLSERWGTCCDGKSGRETELNT